MIRLSETRDEDGNVISAKLEQFIAERESEIGNRDTFEATLRSMAGKSKEAPVTSSPSDGDD